MANQNRTITLTLNAETSGEESIKALAAEMQKLAKGGSDAAPEFERLGNELQQLAAQQGAVRNFAELSNRVDEAANALAEAQVAVRGQAAALDALRPKLEAARAAEAEQAAAVKAATTARDEANASFKEAQAALSAYQAKVGDSRKATAEQSAELNRLRQAVRDTKAAYDASKASVVALKPEYDALKASAKAVSEEFNAQQSALNRATSTANTAQSGYDALAGSLDKAAQKMTAVGVSSTDVASENARIAQSVAQAVNSYDDLVTGLNAAESATEDTLEAQRQAAIAAQKAAEYTRWWSDALNEADAAAKRLEQTRIAEEQFEAARAAQKAAEYTRWWADALDEADRAAAGTAAQAKSLENAFNTLGGRGTAAADAIRAEILKVSQAMMRLAQDTSVTGEDFDRAFATGQARIRELEGRLNSAGAAANRMGDEFSGAFRNFGPASVVFNVITAGINALTDAARNIPRVTAEFQTMERTLRIITGSAEGARKEFEFLRGVANRTGQGIVELSKAYASLSAATKGTAQEGAMTRRVFESVAGAMGTLGKSAADTELALQAVQQMVSKGVVSMEEFRQQLGERLPGVLQVTAKNLNITTAELNDLISSGQMTVDDLFPAMAAGLEELYKTGEANTTLLGQWNAWMNAIKETGAAIGNSGIVQGLLNVAKVGSAAVAAPVEGFVLLGKGIGAVGAALTTGDFKGAWAAFKEDADAADKRVSALVSTSKDAVPTMRQLAEQAQKNGQAFFTTSEGVKIATAAILSSSDALVKFQVESAKAQKAAEDQATSARKLAEYTRAAGELAITTANAIGDENDKRIAATTVATNNAAALDNLLAKEKAVLAVLRERAVEMQTKAKQDGTDTANRKLAAEALQGEIEKRQTVVAGITQQTTAANALAAALKLEAQTLQNNATSVGALTLQYGQFTSALAVARAEVEAGRLTTEQANVVEQAAMQTKALLVDAINDESVAMQTLAKLTGDEKAAVEGSILTAERRLALLRQTGQERTDAAAALQAELLQLQAERQALEDNSGKLAQYRTEYENAKSAVEALTAAKAAGKAVDDELAAAQQRLAQATLTYRDAANDTTAAIEAKNAAKQQQMSLSQALVSLALEEARAAYEIAKANGDERRAAEELVEVKKLERELAILNAEAKRLEAQAAIQVSKAKIEEIRASGELNSAKRAEIAALEASIKVKEVEAQIAGVTAEKLRELAEATAEAENTAGTAAGEYDKLAGSLNNVAAAANAAAAAQKGVSSNWDANGNLVGPGLKGTPTSGGGSFDETWMRLVEKNPFRGNSLSQYTRWLEGIQKAYQAAIERERRKGESSSSAPAEKPGGGSFTIDENGMVKKPIPSVGAPPPAGSNPSGAPAAGKAYTVNVNLGGRTTTINTASQTDAQNLVSMLKNLEQSAGAAY